MATRWSHSALEMWPSCRYVIRLNFDSVHLGRSRAVTPQRSISLAAGLFAARWGLRTISHQEQAMTVFVASIAVRIISSVLTALILAGLFAWLKPNQAHAAHESAAA